MEETSQPLAAQLDADGHELIGKTIIIAWQADFVHVRMVFCEFIAPKSHANGTFAIKAEPSVVKPVGFDVNHNRVARFVEVANGVLAGFVAEETKAAKVVAIGEANAQFTINAKGVGAINGSHLVRGLRVMKII